MKKEDILKKTLNDDDLSHVAGGNNTNGSAAGRGGCEKNFYQRKCAATVEPGSHCGFSSDACSMWVCYTNVLDENGKII